MFRFRFSNSVCYLLPGVLALGLHINGHSAPAVLKTTVTDLTGKTQRLPITGQKATVLIFLAHDCPISNAYAPEINRIASDYSKKGVRLVVAYAESDFDLAGARKHADEYGFHMPVVLDNKYALSRAVGATVTPEVVVLAPDGKQLYRGRIDNRFVKYGKKRSQPTQRDLRAALDAIVAGKSVPQTTTKAIGCLIPETNN